MTNYIASLAAGALLFTAACSAGEGPAPKPATAPRAKPAAAPKKPAPAPKKPAPATQPSKPR